MLHATLELARRVDRVEIDFCALAARAGQRGGADSIEVAGARALCGIAGSPLNKVLGLGLGAPVTDADLDRLTGFYADHREPARVELCPLAPAELGTRLLQHGYVLRGFENQLARSAPFATLPAETVARVRLSHHEERETWVRIVRRGFAVSEGGTGVAPQADGTDADTLATVVRQFVHPEITRYLVEIDGEPAGAGASFVLDRVLGIVGTATLPEHRRRGAQHALVVRALADGGDRADLATATVDPGSTSQRTFERLGFQVIYTRTVFVKPFGQRPA